MTTRRRRVVALPALVAVLVAAVLLASVLLDGRLARVLVERGVPLPGWCALALDGADVALRTDEARDLVRRAVTDAAAMDRPTLTALSGPGAFTCTHSVADVPLEEPTQQRGLTPRAEALRAAVAADFGRIVQGGYDPEGITEGRVRGSAHYEGRAIDYFFRPVGDAQQRARGWLLAHWLVAHAEDLAVATVIFDDRIWSARRSAQGWRDYRHPSGNTTNPVLRHLDHVHVDVQRGG